MLPIRVRRTSRPVWQSPFDLLQNEFDRALGMWFDDSDSDVVGAYPVDIRQDDDHVYVEAELPGFNKDEIELTFENSVLSIVAQRKAEQDKKGQKHLAERRFTRVARSFTLPNTVDENKTDAKLENGVLLLTIDKRQEVKPRKIEVH